MTGPHSRDDDWSRIASLVDELLDAPPAERPARIMELSAGDPARRAELERVLAECEREITLLERPAAERFPSLLDDEPAPFPDVLAERYRVVREIGRGGMATVYLAHDLKHARDVAVKVVHRALESAFAAERFAQEIAIVAQLHHPHIVPLYDSGEANGSRYFVMPYEAGASLRHRLVQEGPLPVHDVVLLLRDVCDALSHAHQAGVVHRDVKPDNVLLAGRHALVSDFGIARSASESSSGAASVTLGTPAYMAPEQITGAASVDHRADVYSVGVLAYELLAGRPPFVATSRDALLDAHRVERPADIATLRPDVPAPLAELVMKCLEKRPEDRWQSADDLVHRLESIASDGAHARPSRRWVVPAALAALFIGGIAATLLVRRQGDTRAASWRARWENARIERITDFPGSEVDAAISADGRSVAFLADRDSVFDAFVSPIGSGRFENLTHGRLPQLFNEDVRNVGFTEEASQLWIRVADIASPASVSLIPATGGSPRPFLGTAVMAVWSPNGGKVAYHETTPGDPIYVANGDGRNARRIHIAEPGVHNHHLAWSPDGRFLYFTSGLPPGEMDVWRIPSVGGKAERITQHDSRVSHPTPLDDRTLVYTATADDGTGPWLYMMDLEDRVPTRVSTGIEHYLSVSAGTASAATAGHPRRLVATVSNPSATLWTAPIARDVVTEREVRPLALPTARAAAPRFASDSTLFYLASRGGADGLWRRAGSDARELWSASRGAVVGASAVSPDGKRVCFPVRRTGHSTLHCSNADGTGMHAVAEQLDVRGAASWSNDGRWLAVAAREGRGLRVFKVPMDGGAPVRLVDAVSSNPVWSPDGAFILYSGTPRGRSVPVKAVTPDGRPYAIPQLTVDRVGDSYRFLPDGKLVVKLGGFRQQDFWLFDLGTGAKRRLTTLDHGESLPRFDVSHDGTRIVFERVRENSDIVLIELAAP